jgi:hypothetical protein
MLYWDYANAECRAVGALPPEPLVLPYGEQPSNSPFISKDYTKIWRAIESGYVTQPSDCPPVRLISHYGFLVRCPGKVFIRRLSETMRFRKFESGRAMFGITEVGGDRWPEGDSGFIASWIAGSEFVKIQTGILIFFPTRYYLYQGPLPNTTLLKQSNIDVMAGLEYATNKRMTEINSQQYGVANLNIIIQLPNLGETINLNPGDLLAWFFVVPAKGAVRLKHLGLSSSC